MVATQVLVAVPSYGLNDLPSGVGFAPGLGSLRQLRDLVDGFAEVARQVDFLRMSFFGIDEQSAAILDRCARDCGGGWGRGRVRRQGGGRLTGGGGGRGELTGHSWGAACEVLAHLLERVVRAASSDDDKDGDGSAEAVPSARLWALRHAASTPSTARGERCRQLLLQADTLDAVTTAVCSRLCPWRGRARLAAGRSRSHPLAVRTHRTHASRSASCRRPGPSCRPCSCEQHPRCV